MREPDSPLRDDDVDRRFAEIVAGWHSTSTPGAVSADSATDAVAAAGDDATGATAGEEAQPGPGAEADRAPAAAASQAGAPDAIDPVAPNAIDPMASDVQDPTHRRGPINPPLFERRPIHRIPPPPNFPVWRGATNQTPYDEILDRVEDDDHFEPPEPRPLPPQEDLHFWGILTGLIGGPLLLLYLVLFRPEVSSWWIWLAIAMSLGGFVLLVLRGPSDDDHGNGAIV